MISCDLLKFNDLGKVIYYVSQRSILERIAFLERIFKSFQLAVLWLK